MRTGRDAGNRRGLFALLLPFTLAGCGAMNDCSKPRVYQEARSGTHVETPDGLDPLAPEKELTIPKASPQAPPPPGACIDAPPTLRTGGDEDRDAA